MRLALCSSLLFLSVSAIATPTASSSKLTLNQGESTTELLLNNSSKKEEDPYNDRKNIVKINLTSLTMRNFSFQYERSIHRKISAAIGFRFMPGGRMFLAEALGDAAVQDGADETQAYEILSNMRTGGWAITPEVKFFVGKGNGRGFYFAPFYRYESYSLTSSGTYVDDFGQNKVAAYTGDFRSSGAGIMMGVQFLIRNRINIDWWILGPYFAAQRIELTGQYEYMSPTDQQDLRDMVSDIANEYNANLTSTVSGTNAQVNYKGRFLPTRFMGLTVGVKF